MTRSDLPRESAVPEPTVRELQALYREAATAEPGPMLDRRILEAARAELHPKAATTRQLPWWKGWLPALSAIALVMAGLSVTWRVMDEQEHRLREEMQATKAMREVPGQSAGSAAPAERGIESGAAINLHAPAAEKRRRTESATVQDAPMGVPEPATRPGLAAPAVPAVPAAPEPMLAEDVQKKSQRTGKDELLERRAAGAAMESASDPLRQAGKLEARHLGATAADSAAQSALDGATIDAWLQQIRELRAAGRGTEAAQSLARFRARYPDFVLPADLLERK